jgi:radical SAM superfamily enzyme YgiQ (UPF0313 family)
VIGGYHATFLDKEVVKEDCVDFVVRGEGEETFTELCRAIIQKKDLSKVRGITTKKGRNPNRPVMNLKNLPVPAYYLLKKYKYKFYSPRIETARGCPFRCLFCSECRFWNGIRFKTKENLIEELHAIKENLPYAKTSFIPDSIFPLNEKQLNNFCSAIKETGFDYQFRCNSRFGFLNDKYLEKMKKVGFVGFFFGMESASDEMLRKMNKHATFKQYIKHAELVKKHNLLLTSSWILGFPGETIKTAKESIKGLDYLLERKLITQAWIRTWVPYPGTPPFDFPEKFGVKILSRNWADYSRVTKLPFVYELDTLSQEELYELYLEMLRHAYEHFRNY